VFLFNLYNGKNPRSLRVKKTSDFYCSYLKGVLWLVPEQALASKETIKWTDRYKKYNLYYVPVQFYFLELYLEVVKCTLLDYYAAT